MWGFNSSLANCTNEILCKLEGRMMSNNNQFGQGMMMSAPDEKALMNDMEAKLKSKSIEELIYINFNPEHFIDEFTQEGRRANENLLNEVKALSQQYNQKKAEYDNIKAGIEQCKVQYEQKENELRDLYSKKQMIDSQMSVDMLMDQMKKMIEETYQRPRQQLISELMNKKITFEEFQDKFKDLTVKYHYYSIIKDKLNQCK